MKKCINCGEEIKPGENFCGNCGEKVVPDIVQNQETADNEVAPNNEISATPSIESTPSINNQNSNRNIDSVPVVNIGANQNVSTEDLVVKAGASPTEVVDNELMDAYIGKNSEKIKSGAFSWWAMLFGPIYFFYRKMWLYGFFYLIAMIVVTAFLSSIAPILEGLAWVFVGKMFNEWYLSHAKDEINRIKTVNQDKSKEEIKNLCSSKGGTTIVPVIIYIALILLFYVFAFSAVYNYLTKASGGSGEYKIGDLYYEIPNSLEEGEYNDENFKSYKSLDNSKEYCNISFSTYMADLYENDSVAFLNQNVSTNGIDTRGEIETESLNKIEWKHQTVTTNISERNYYATLNGDKIYFIEFSKYNEEKTCNKIYDEIIKSLEFGEK